MRWAEIRIETTPEAAEAVSELMMSHGCRGTATAGERPVVVTGHLPVDDSLEPRLLGLRDSLPGLREAGLDLGPGTLTATIVEDEDWANAWKQFFKPMRIGERIVIKPSWEEYNAQPGDVIVELDPGMAFGSGTHASTALCLRALETRVKPGDSVLDVGCGSGILAIGAAKLGATKVIACDDDSIAVRVAIENARINGVESLVQVRQSDLLAQVPESGRVIVSNIIADVVIRLAPEIPAHLESGGFWISSGIIDTRLADVTAAIEKAGMRVLEVLSREEWVAVVATAG